METGSATTVSGWRWVAAFAALYIVVAIEALELTQGTAGIAYVWPPSGVGLGGMLLLRGRDRWKFLGLIAAGSVFANAVYGATPVSAIGFTVANLAETLVATRIACDRREGCASFVNPRWVTRFAGAACMAAAVSGLLASPFAAGGPSFEFILSWCATVLLGILIVTPGLVTLVASLRQSDLEKSANRADPVKLCLLIAAILVVTELTFLQNSYPLLFLPLVLVTCATYMFGVSGAVASVFVVALIGSLATAWGMGPVHFIAGLEERAYFLQAYLLVLLASALPLATVLAEARQKDAAIRESNNLLEAAEKIAHVGHWHYDFASDTNRWSAETFRIYGLEYAEVVSTDTAIEAYHPDDQGMVRDSLAMAVRTGNGFDFTARIRRPGGEIRHVTGRGEVVKRGSRVTGLFGVLFDVTDRIELLAELDEARKLAEERAEEASRLAETDPLTGVANRRRAMAELAEQMTVARESGNPLSVVMIDVDHFKSINDSYGHGVGDLVLQRIAASCTSCLRPTDLFARIGGEEFLAILPRTDKDRAAKVAERLREVVADLSFSRGEEPESVSISLGVAVHQEMADETWMLQAADMALYQAKAEGRNRFTLAA